MTKILFKDSKIYVNNKPITLLCSSLFYFRIPEDLWEDRIVKIKSLGYNCLDVYFPWNFHELEEDSWDFTGMKDISKFLELAKKHEMYIVGRPGPYICSEWDLGSLPSYLLTKENVKLRDNNEQYLIYVKKWYNKILSILKEHQITNNGNILMIQLENELDFYNCSDRHGYISALKHMALENGIDIPLIACAGQGDIDGATGLVEAVYPAMNFYPNSYDPNFASQCQHYIEILKEKNYPLLVTETNREAFFLRRLLGTGVRLIGPYNQVGGTDFDFFNAVNNWGNPLSFLTSDYDFGSIIKPSGEFNYDYKEAYIFKGLVTTFNESLGDSDIILDHEFSLSTSNPDIAPVTVLRNSNNEYFVTIANCGNTESEFTVNCNNSSLLSEDLLHLTKAHCQTLLYNINLDKFGFSGVIDYCSCDILDIHMNNMTLNINTFTKTSGKLVISTPVSVSSSTDEKNCTFHNNVITINLQSNNSAISIYLDDNSIININNISYDSIEEPNNTIILDNDSINLSMTNITDLSDNNFAYCKNSLYLEDNNGYSGYGVYKNSVNLSNEICKYVILENPSDILSVYINDTYHGTFTPGGTNLLVKPLCECSNINLSIKAEIWGHTNFDDIALPCTSLNSKKGVKNIGYITSVEDISCHWNLVQVGNDKKKHPIYSSFGSFLSTIIPFYGVYEKTLNTNKNHNLYCLLLEDSTASGNVYVNNVFVGELSTVSSLLNISDYIKENTTFDLRIEVTKETHRSSSGIIKLLSGYQGSNTSLQKIDKQAILNTIQNIDNLSPTSLPLTFTPGNNYMLKVDVKNASKDLYINIKASNIKLTTIVHDMITSRIMASTNEEHPIMCGGNNNNIFIPKSWLQKANGSFYIYVEAINFGDCILEGLYVNIV